MAFRQKVVIVVITSAWFFAVVGWLCQSTAMATGEPQPTGDVAVQFKELQKQVAELQKQVAELQKNRVVAAGTATWTRPALQANRTRVRVKLPADIAAGLGKDYVVLLTNHYPRGGYPYFAPLWTPAADGFDLTLVDTSINEGTTSTYDNPNTTYLVDWAVVKK
jgi:hypothetical protein